MGYLGLTDILGYSEVLADIEGEQETVPDLTEEDFEPQEGSTNTDSIGLPSQWEEAISSVASGKGITDETHREYIFGWFFFNTCSFDFK